MSGEKLLSLDVASGKLIELPFSIGSGTAAARDALSSPQAGWQWYDTDWRRIDIYDGEIWIPAGATRFINKTGETSVRGKTVQSTSGLIDGSVELTGSADDINVIGVIYTAGVADGDPIAVFTQSGAKIEYLMQANDDTDNGWWISAQIGGISESVSNSGTGCCGVTVEAKDDTVPYLVKGISGLFTEIY